MTKEEMLFFKKHSYLKSPKILNLEITNRCPLRCPQCYKDPLAEADMDFGLFKDVAKQAAMIGVKRVMLNGGEPVLHPQFFDMVEILNKYDILPSCFTSGFGIDKDFVDALQKYDIEFLLSFNGSNEKVHSISRDAFNITSRVAALFKESGYGFEVNWVARNDNVMDFPNLIKKMKELGCAKITIVCNKINGSCHVESALTKEDYIFLKEQVIDNDEFVTIQNCNNIMAQYFYDMPQSRLYGCPAGVSSMCVTVDGSFVPCPHLYFKEKAGISLLGYWNNSVQLNQLRVNQTASLKYCENCARNVKCNFCRAICPESYRDFSVGYVSCPLYERGEQN